MLPSLDPAWAPRCRGTVASVSSVRSSQPASLELPVEELLCRARPLPPHDEMVIDDLDEAETAAFLALLKG